MPAILCRRIRDEDAEAAVDLLARGFPERSSEYWRQAWHRLRERAVPETMPRYGYVIADGARLVGILLVIFAPADDGGLRGNVSSWYVEPDYRTYSSLLLAAPMRLKGVTLVNISPAPGTLETIGAQGFVRYAAGTFHALALLSPRVPGATIRAVGPATPGASAVLRDHAAWGCLAYEATLAGETHPFVFAPFRSFGGRLPCAQLVYCRDIASFVRFAGPLGRRLARHGLPSVMLDATGPVETLIGRYLVGKRLKFYRGTKAPRLGDLSYTELALFGA
jgi:hypothetical protein